jgi:malate/lactate dehydrogenase
MVDKKCSVTANSDCDADYRSHQQDGESHLSLVQRNSDVFVIPQIIKYCSDFISVVISLSVDILTDTSWELSELLKHHVIVNDYNVDSTRFFYFVAEKLGVLAAVF